MERDPESPQDFLALVAARRRSIAKLVQRLINRPGQPPLCKSPHYGRRAADTGDEDPHCLVLFLSSVFASFHGRYRMATRLEEAEVVRMNDMLVTVGKGGIEVSLEAS